MIVFDLQCREAHVFEAWFSSSASFEEQKQNGHLMCPVCQSSDVAKALMAPRIGAKGNRRADSPVVNTLKPKDDAPDLRKLMATVAKAQAEALKSSQWVGRDFDRKARAMDAGEETTKSIHGQTTPDQARALIEDGIGVMPLLVPVVPPEELN
jgi:hypothetical protein